MNAVLAKSGTCEKEGNKAKQKWFLTMPDASTNTVKKKNIIGFNGSLRAEFINSDYVRWVTEFQFNQKGCKDKTDSATFVKGLRFRNVFLFM